MEPKSGKRVNKMKTVAFVPVKLNNERLPGKNTKPFHNGDPLICYILRTLMNSMCIAAIPPFRSTCPKA